MPRILWRATCNEDGRFFPAMQVPFLWHFATFEQASKCCLTQICGETYQEAGHLSGNGDDFICPAIDGSDGRPNLISIY